MWIASSLLLNWFETFGIKPEIAKVLKTNIFPTGTAILDVSIFGVKPVKKGNISNDSLKIAIDVSSRKVNVSFYSVYVKRNYRK